MPPETERAHNGNKSETQALTLSKFLGMHLTQAELNLAIDYFFFAALVLGVAGFISISIYLS